MFTGHTHSARNLGFIFDEKLKTSPFPTRYQLCLNPATRTSVNFAASDHISITKQPVPLPPSLCTPSLTKCNSLYYNQPNTQLNRLQHIQNSHQACAVVRVPKSSHINPALRSLHWFKINQCIDYKNSFSHVQNPHYHSTFIST